MTPDDILGWLIAAIALLALYALTNKQRWGWIAYLAGQVASMVLYYRLALWGLFFVNIIFAVVSVRGYIKWGSEDPR